MIAVSLSSSDFMYLMHNRSIYVGVNFCMHFWLQTYSSGAGIDAHTMESSSISSERCEALTILLISDSSYDSSGFMFEGFIVMYVWLCSSRVGRDPIPTMINMCNH